MNRTLEAQLRKIEDVTSEIKRVNDNLQGLFDGTYEGLVGPISMKIEDENALINRTSALISIVNSLKETVGDRNNKSIVTKAIDSVKSEVVNHQSDDKVNVVSDEQESINTTDSDFDEDVEENVKNDMMINEYDYSQPEDINEDENYYEPDMEEDVPEEYLDTNPNEELNEMSQNLELNVLDNMCKLCQDLESDTNCNECKVTELQLVLEGID